MQSQDPMTNKKLQLKLTYYRTSLQEVPQKRSMGAIFCTQMKPYQYCCSAIFVEKTGKQKQKVIRSSSENVVRIFLASNLILILDLRMLVILWRLSSYSYINKAKQLTMKEGPQKVRLLITLTFSTFFNL